MMFFVCLRQELERWILVGSLHEKRGLDMILEGGQSDGVFRIYAD